MSVAPKASRVPQTWADMAMSGDSAASLTSSGKRRQTTWPPSRLRTATPRGRRRDGGTIDDVRHLHMSAPRARTGPMRLRCFEYERPRRRRVERHVGEHLEGDPVQVRLPLPFHGEAAPQMLSAHHILQRLFTICPEAEYNKGLPEDRVLCVKGENLQR